MKWKREKGELVVTDGNREAAVWNCSNGSKNHMPWAWSVYETNGGTSKRLFKGSAWSQGQAKAGAEAALTTSQRAEK